MAAPVPLFNLMQISVSNIPKQELLIIEAELLVRICEELKRYFKEQYANYFRLMKLSKEMEISMLESSFVSLIVKDILSTQEYTLQGIAEYTNFHEDVVVDVIAGTNVSPSSLFLTRIIDLHRLVRSDLYESIMKKIIGQYLVSA